MVALWNNFHASAQKNGLAIPPEPLWLIKAPTCFAAHGARIRPPSSYDGRVVYEGELGIVIGRTCSGVSVEQAPDYILGYTCINDVTALDIVGRDSSFAQWTRAKNFDTFGIFGPIVATGLDPQTLASDNDSARSGRGHGHGCLHGLSPSA